MSEAPLLCFRLTDGRAATLLMSSASTVLSVEETWVSSWDLSGRPYALVRPEGTFRRALDGGHLYKREATGRAPRVRRRLTAAEGAPVVEEARLEASSALTSVLGDPAGLDTSLAEVARERLLRIVGMNAEALETDAARFTSVVGRVGILPPDQYLALVVRGTEGCSWDGCSFCALYKDIPFRWRTPEELRSHVAALRDYFGESLALRRSVFLGDANALCLAHQHLLPLFEVLAAELPGRPVYSFVDVTTGRRKRTAEWHAYAALGLKRVYLGLETGDPDLLAWLRKPGSPAEAVDLVETLREAGVPVGIIVLLGAGGERYSDGHVSRTAEVLAAMKLQREDLLYFADFVPDPRLDYARRAGDAMDLQPLAAEGCALQRRSILAILKITETDSPVRIASYDIRDFVY